MAKIIKKCLACGTLNPYDAEVCKNCESPLLADVDQEDEILSIDPMEAAIEDAVSETEGEDDLVAQILREQAENAKRIVAKEKAKEERKKKKQAARSMGSPFSRTSSEAGSSFGFSLGNDSAVSTYQSKDEDDPGRVHLSGSLRMQTIRMNQEAEKKNKK